MSHLSYVFCGEWYFYRFGDALWPLAVDLLGKLVQENRQHFDGTSDWDGVVTLSKVLFR